MTPGARLAAAAEILDGIQAGARAEAALTRWARGSRFAGSKDRAAVRDHVFDVLRRKRSCAALGGGDSGRALIIGLLRGPGVDPADLMTGTGYDMRPPEPHETGQNAADLPRAVANDLPDWIMDRLDTDHPGDADQIAQTLRHRAPVFVRVNSQKEDLTAVQTRLAHEDIETQVVDGVATALRVTRNERRLRQSEVFTSGLIEMQCASSQRAVLHLPLTNGQRVLDFCAGGGGKALATAACADVDITAHDAHPARMKDLPVRATRAGVTITIAETAALADHERFDLVLVDAPCSGSGTWRRDPDAKWRLTPLDLDQLAETQVDILAQASDFVSDGGTLAYMTCSVFHCENAAVIHRFDQARTDWTVLEQTQWLPSEQGDGFYLSTLKKTS